MMEFGLIIVGWIALAVFCVGGFAIVTELSSIHSSLTATRVTLDHIREALNRLADSHEKISKRY